MQQAEMSMIQPVEGDITSNISKWLEIKGYDKEALCNSEYKEIHKDYKEEYSSAIINNSSSLLQCPYYTRFLSPGTITSTIEKEPGEYVDVTVRTFIENDEVKISVSEEPASVKID